MMWAVHEQEFLLELAGKLEPVDLGEIERGYAMLAALGEFFANAYEAAFDAQFAAVATVGELEVELQNQADLIDDRDAEVQAMQLEIDALRTRNEALRTRNEELKRVASAS
jgi:hypothetical protein